MDLSEIQLESICKSLESALKHNKVPKKYIENVVLTTKMYIQKTGLDENVCPCCLGTGKEY